GLEDGGFPERIAQRLRRLELEHHHVGERRRPVENQHQAGKDDRRLGQRAAALALESSRHQWRKNCFIKGTLSKPSLATTFDSITGISRAPQSGLKKLGCSFQSPGRW